MANVALCYRPLRASTGIYNPLTKDSGTLGYFARDEFQAPWIISCHHVLIGPGIHPQKIYQPDDQTVDDWIAETNAARMDPGLDIAAARVRPGVRFAPEIAGLGALDEPTPAFVGMRVFKVGMRTGLTEGTVASVTNDDITIQPGAFQPAAYRLSDRGDSGSLWIEQSTFSPVGIHYAGNVAGAELAHARPIDIVLRTLRLSL
jgi:hypothetical protein